MLQDHASSRASSSIHLIQACIPGSARMKGTDQNILQPCLPTFSHPHTRVEQIPPQPKGGSSVLDLTSSSWGTNCNKQSIA
uniref:Uncharacterized protein n=1 Tax=Arundo donax TaxID=35708 RepID=A0A0A9GX35_ARUDO